MLAHKAIASRHSRGGHVWATHLRSWLRAFNYFLPTTWKLSAIVFFPTSNLAKFSLIPTSLSLLPSVPFQSLGQSLSVPSLLTEAGSCLWQLNQLLTSFWPLSAASSLKSGFTDFITLGPQSPQIMVFRALWMLMAGIFRCHSNQASEEMVAGENDPIIKSLPGNDLSPSQQPNYAYELSLIKQCSWDIRKAGIKWAEFFRAVLSNAQ